MGNVFGRTEVRLLAWGTVMATGLVGLALREDAPPAPPPVRAQATCPFAEAASAAGDGMATLLLGTGPIGARVVVDGLRMPRPTPFTREAPLHLAPGRHAFRFVTADGSASLYEIDLVPGDNVVMIPLLGEPARRGAARLVGAGDRPDTIDL